MDLPKFLKVLITPLAALNESEAAFTAEKKSCFLKFLYPQRHKASLEGREKVLLLEISLPPKAYSVPQGQRKAAPENLSGKRTGLAPTSALSYNDN